MLVPIRRVTFEHYNTIKYFFKCDFRIRFLSLDSAWYAYRSQTRQVWCWVIKNKKIGVLSSWSAVFGEMINRRMWKDFFFLPDVPCVFDSDYFRDVRSYRHLVKRFCWGSQVNWNVSVHEKIIKCINTSVFTLVFEVFVYAYLKPVYPNVEITSVFNVQKFVSKCTTFCF